MLWALYFYTRFAKVQTPVLSPSPHWDHVLWYSIARQLLLHLDYFLFFSRRRSTGKLSCQRVYSRHISPRYLSAVLSRNSQTPVQTFPLPLLFDSQPPAELPSTTCTYTSMHACSSALRYPLARTRRRVIKSPIGHGPRDKLNLPWQAMCSFSYCLTRKSLAICTFLASSRFSQ